jgi:hypothetical protein
MFATDRCHQLDDPWADRAVAVRFHDEPGSVDAIVRAAQERPVDGVLAVGDRPTVIAAAAAAALNIPWHPPDAVAAARQKPVTRARLSDARLAVPWFQTVSTGVDASVLARMVEYPCVVKPAALSGSRGVIRADDPPSFVAAFERLRKLLLSKDVRTERDEAHDNVIVEEFIPGREFAVEAFLDHGRFHPIAIFDKPDPLDGPFFEESIYVTPSGEPRAEQSAILSAVGQAAAAIGLRHGPIHAECRTNSRGVFVLEVAARPIGGLCARVLRSDADAPDAVRSYEAMLLRHAAGESPAGWAREANAAGVMMIPIPRRGLYRVVDGVEDACEVAGVERVDITAKPDQLLVPLPEGASYLGFIFARASDPRAVVDALRTAHARLSFTIEPELRVVARAER